MIYIYLRKIKTYKRKKDWEKQKKKINKIKVFTKEKALKKKRFNKRKSLTKEKVLKKKRFNKRKKYIITPKKNYLILQKINFKIIFTKEKFY